MIVVVIPWVLAIKKEAISAIAWSLHGHLCCRSLGRPVLRAVRVSKRPSAAPSESGGTGEIFECGIRPVRTPGPAEGRAGRGPRRIPGRAWADWLAGSMPIPGHGSGNKLTFYSEGQPAFDDMLAAIREAKHHVHVEFFIFQYDTLGRQFLDLLAEKAKQGVEVRLLYDAMGSRKLGRWKLRKLRWAGGRCSAFLPVSLFRRRIQVNLRNHRKILVVDGKVAFTGGLNIGDEYVGKNPSDSATGAYLRACELEGPTVAESLQRTFIEDWDFASGESLDGEIYFQATANAGDESVQVIQSGPDQEVKAIREICLAAVFKARRRLWITTPYYVPDQGLRDALCLAGRIGIDVRLLLPFEADHTAVHYASLYYLTDLLDAGVKVYLYTNGFIHSKVWLVDGLWASVGHGEPGQPQLAAQLRG